MKYFIYGLAFLLLWGCTPAKRGNDGRMSTYTYSQNMEAEWIRNGEPIEFEGELWYPRDSVETLLDSEVQLLGVHRDIQYFVDKIDVRPYRRLYTKFNSKRFRVFMKNKINDNGQ